MAPEATQSLQFVPNPRVKLNRDRTVIRLPSYEAVKSDPVLYAHANRVLHLETNPGNARALVQAHAERAGFSVVREFCGHGIGRKFHEEPQVLHYGKAGTGLALQPGMTFTVEPMINAGKPGIRELADGWTIVTKDHSLSAQWEHTVAVTEDGYEVLTLSAGVQPEPAIGSEATSK